jgi:ATP phosphoribosyltransferase
LNDAGLNLKVETRGYRPTFGVPGFDVKLLKPQNIVEMVNLGSRDIGFTGADLVEELGAKDITRVSFLKI